MGVSDLPVLAFSSWRIRGLRVTIPEPRGRKSLSWKKKKQRKIYTQTYSLEIPNIAYVQSYTPCNYILAQTLMTNI